MGKNNKTDANAEIIRFPSTLASEAEKGHNHIRLEVHELQNGTRINPFVFHLFQPVGFVVTDGGNYGTMDRGAMGAGMNAILQGIGLKSAEDTGLTKSDLVAASAMNIEAIAGGIKQVGALAGSLAGTGGRLGALEKGIAQNQFTNVTYEGPQLRSFQMDFKLISESQEEANTIRRIVDILRNYSMPESTGSLSIQYPAHFEIEFFRGEKRNTFMPLISTCHLTSLATTYNQTTNIFHADGSPVETDIALTFQETKTLTRQDLYNTDDGTDLPGLDEQTRLDKKAADALTGDLTVEPEAVTNTGTPPNPETPGG